MKIPDPLFDTHTDSALRGVDDLLSLKQHLSDDKFQYVDIATEQARVLALKRWPLMEELHLFNNRHLFLNIPTLIDREKKP